MTKDGSLRGRARRIQPVGRSSQLVGCGRIQCSIRPHHPVLQPYVHPGERAPVYRVPLPRSRQHYPLDHHRALVDQLPYPSVAGASWYAFLVADLIDRLPSRHRGADYPSAELVRHCFGHHLGQPRAQERSLRARLRFGRYSNSHWRKQLFLRHQYVSRAAGSLLIMMAQSPCYHSRLCWMNRKDLGPKTGGITTRNPKIHRKTTLGVNL